MLLIDATLEHAPAIAALHAASWRAFYRGALSDSYLDGDILSERQSVWTSRLSDPEDSQKVVAALLDGELVGFACAFGNHDTLWGTLLDNLHVAASQQRTGVGTQLLMAALQWSVDAYPAQPLHLWVIQSNRRALAFYEAHGGQVIDEDLWNPPCGGNSVPRFRVVWDQRVRGKLTSTHTTRVEP